MSVPDIHFPLHACVCSVDMTETATLQQAAEDASWLVERGYPGAAVSEFVATHRGLDDAQRALLACNAELNASFRHHIAREMDAEDVRKRTLAIDADSAVRTVAAALAGRRLLESSAGVLLDPAWIRGPWAENAGNHAETALSKLAAVLDELRPARVRWTASPSDTAWLEQATASLGKRKWKSEVVGADNVVAALSGGAFVVSSDPAVLDGCATWVNVVGLAVEGVHAPRLKLNP